ncbi:virulence factor TspB C-terminal domain-related protein [Neisseria musculi]
MGSFEFDYAYICNVLRLIRPILITATIITCGFVAYGAVKEL